jgi:hypothetical protein
MRHSKRSKKNALQFPWSAFCENFDQEAATHHPSGYGINWKRLFVTTMLITLILEHLHNNQG